MADAIDRGDYYEIDGLPVAKAGAEDLIQQRYKDRIRVGLSDALAPAHSGIPTPAPAVQPLAVAVDDSGGIATQGVQQLPDDVRIKVEREAAIAEGRTPPRITNGRGETIDTATGARIGGPQAQQLTQPGQAPSFGFAAPITAARGELTRNARDLQKSIDKAAGVQNKLLDAQEQIQRRATEVELNKLQAQQDIDALRLGVQADAAQRRQNIADLASSKREEYRTKIEEARQKYADVQISDPRSEWSLGDRVLAAISIGLGAIGAGVTGGPNYAMQIIDDTIQREMTLRREKQAKLRDEIGDTKDELADYEASIGDSQLATKVWEADQLLKVEQEALGRLSQVSTDAQKLNGENLILAIREKRADAIAAAEQRRAELGMNAAAQAASIAASEAGVRLNEAQIAGQRGPSIPSGLQLADPSRQVSEKDVEKGQAIASDIGPAIEAAATINAAITGGRTEEDARIATKMLPALMAKNLGMDDEYITENILNDPAWIDNADKVERMKSIMASVVDVANAKLKPYNLQLPQRQTLSAKDIAKGAKGLE
ncbi:MAG: hypothetical protein E6Q97_37500 [Desulfurellales bacterium]|nr:MAG: hypothetical protein E6Q97_37500 [Desulfurellales bacterium]